jgi:hypothetical protein
VGCCQALKWARGFAYAFKICKFALKSGFTETRVDALYKGHLIESKVGFLIKPPLVGFTLPRVRFRVMAKNMLICLF